MSNAAEYATIRNELQIYDNLPVGQWQGALQGFNTNGAYTRTDNGNVLSAVFTPDDLQKFGMAPILWCTRIPTGMAR
jgi:hypothetical protein